MQIVKMQFMNMKTNASVSLNPKKVEDLKIKREDIFK